MSASVKTDVNFELFTTLALYNELSLSQTCKGPTNLFEIEKVRDRENYSKNQNFY